jgi:hypothetical protein
MADAPGQPAFAENCMGYSRSPSSLLLSFIFFIAFSKIYFGPLWAPMTDDIMSGASESPVSCKPL